MTDDLHAESSRERRHDPADLSAAHDAKRLPFEFKTLAAGPAAGLDRRVGVGERSGEGQDHADRQFRHAAGIGSISAANLDASPPGRLQVDRIDSRAVAADDAEIARGGEHVVGDRLDAGEPADAAGQELFQV